MPALKSAAQGPIFIGLNVLRALSMIGLLLVFIANIVTLVGDGEAIREDRTSAVPTTSRGNTTSSNSTMEFKCDYIFNSTIPDQAGGAFWSVLNRVFILMETMLLIAAEVGFPRKIFETFLPMLGPEHGLGCLGAFQTLVLSHYSDLFPQVSSWLLFTVGCLNMLAGITWRQEAKAKRALFSWENIASLWLRSPSQQANNSTPQTKLAAETWNTVHHWKISREEQKAASRNTPSPDSAYSQEAPSDNPYSNALKNAPTHIDVSAPSAPQQAHHYDKDRSRRLV